MVRHFYSSILFLTAIIGSFCLFSGQAAWATPGFQPSVYTQPAEQACITAIELAEKHKQLPRLLLKAIAMTESGRWDAEKKQSMPWPWTVTSGSESWYFESKAEAIAHVKSLQGKGRTNIDVGCMQVNLYYHPDAFVSLEAAFEPVLNARYAADYLKGLRNEYKSWTKAIRYYHSKNDEFNRPYRRKVYDWRAKLRAQEQAQLREEVKRQAEARRIAREAEKEALNALKPTKAAENQHEDKAAFLNTAPETPTPMGEDITLASRDSS